MPVPGAQLAYKRQVRTVAAEVVAFVAYQPLVLVAALLRLDADDSRHGLPVLSVEATRDHFHFLNGLRAELQSETRSGERVLDRDAVDQVSVLVRTAAADVDLVVGSNHADLGRHHVLHVFHDQAGQFLAAKALSAGCLLDVEQRLFTHDHHFLTKCQHCGLQLEVHRDRLPRAHFYPGDFDFPVADHPGTELVSPRPHVRDHVLSVGAAGSTVVGPHDHDVHARQRVTCFLVDNLSPNGSASPLGQTVPRERQQ